MRQKKGTERCGSGKSKQAIYDDIYIKEFVRNVTELWAKNGISARIPNSFRSLLPTNKNLREAPMNGFQKKYQELRQRSYDSSEQLRSMSGEPGFCPTQCGELPQNGSRAHFWGSPKFEGNTSP